MPRWGGSGLDSAFRADIQGLRALAVILVVADHTVGMPSGGFVGVDVFYVISGYLITSILMREIATTGGISFRAFYARRIKRILPAATVVLFVTTTVAYLVWYLPRATQTALDALAAALFVENWHLIGAGTNYLQADRPVSPLQHYWSLSIEEQFYALWPLLLFAAVRVVPARYRHAAIVSLITIGATTSLTWSAYWSFGSPASSYFDTIGRAWELLAGAGLALTGTATRLHPAARALASTVGLAVIVFSAFAITPFSQFPFPWAMAPVIGTLLVIAAAAPQNSFLVKPLVNRVSQYLGQISYSLYLWHFPVVIFIGAALGNTALATLVMTAGALVLGSISYHFIEQPGIRSAFLRRSIHARTERSLLQRFALPLSLIILLTAMSGLQYKGPRWLVDASALLTKAPYDGEGSRPDPASLRVLVREASTARHWPTNLTPSLDQLDYNQEAEAMLPTAPGCRNSVEARGEPLLCTYGPKDAGNSVMVVGDSVALSWMPSIRSAYSGSRVVGLGYASCPLYQVDAPPQRGDTQHARDCDASRRKMLYTIKTVHPKILIISAAQRYLNMLESGATGQAAADEWRVGVRTAVMEAAPYVGEIIVLGSPPVAADPRECTTRLAGPEACLMKPDTTFIDKQDAERLAVQEASSAGLPVTSVDVRDLFCSQWGCPAFIATTPVRVDDTHITESAAILVADALRSLLPA
jgi:peptidoglycan/LPS O-acetylase OafA/YrhL